MNRKIALAALAATALSSAAFAAEDPQPIKGSNDVRLRQIAYSDSRLYRITSTDMTPVTITFSEGEKVIMLAGLKVVDATPADAGKEAKPEEIKAAQAASLAAEAACRDAGWCAQRSGNQLSLQPAKSDEGSVVMVTTEKQGSDGSVVHRHYPYELHTRQGRIAETLKDGTKGEQVVNAADPEAYFAVSYRYPDEDAAKHAAWRLAHAGEIAAAKEAAAQRVVADRLKAGNYQPGRNHKWSFNDSPACRDVGPYDVSDNGRETVLHFRMNASGAIPNIVHNDGTESLAQYFADTAPNGDVVMVIKAAPGRVDAAGRPDPTKPAIDLHRGKTEACGLYNQGYDPNATAPNTGTSAPDVMLETRR